MYNHKFSLSYYVLISLHSQGELKFSHIRSAAVQSSTREAKAVASASTLCQLLAALCQRWKLSPEDLPHSPFLVQP